MKKNTRIIGLMIVSLALAALACNMPFIGQVGETVTDQFVEPSSTPQTSGFSGETQVYSSKGVQINLPVSYELGDIEAQVTNLFDKIQSLPEFGSESIQQFYSDNQKDILFWAYDAGSAEGSRTHVLIMKNEEFAGMPLGIISTLARTLLGDSVGAIEPDRLTLGSHDTLRLQVSAGEVGIDQTQVVYLLKDSGKLWVIGFLTTQDQIEQGLSAFDAAVASFTVIDVD